MSRTQKTPSKNVNQGNSQDSRYYGLINQGATCYLNSVLQVLFMTEGFREAVSRKNVSQNGIDLELYKLFKNLSNKKAETTGVTKKLRIKKVNEQQDAAEYFERILTKTNDEAKQIFKGELTYTTVCQCKSITDEKVSFLNLPLPLMDCHDKTYSVVDGIEEFFKNSEFTGENQLYCETCKNKCDATIQCKVKHHPEVVMLLLKRFEFNYRHMQYMKNSLPVDVSLTITLPENQRYELYALVEHMGTLKSGHYMATIKPQNEDRWYEFNDSSVIKLENKKVKNHKLQKSQCAYLLFYRKSNAGAQNEEEMCTMPEAASLNHNITGSCQNVNRNENNLGRKDVLHSQTTSSAFAGEEFLEVNDNGDPARQMRQKSSLPNKDGQTPHRNTNDSSTRQQNPCESKDKSGNFNRWDTKVKSFYLPHRDEARGENALNSSLSCACTSGNDRTVHTRSKSDRNAHTRNAQEQQWQKASSEQNTSRKPQQKINARLTCQAHNQVKLQDYQQLQAKVPSEAKSSLKGIQGQKGLYSLELDCNTTTIDDESYRRQKGRNTNGDDDQKDDHHSTTGEQGGGSMEQGDQSHGEITQDRRELLCQGRHVKQAPDGKIGCSSFSIKRCKGKQNSQESETTHGSQDGSGKNRKDSKKKRGKSTKVNGDKHDEKCCIC